MSTKKTSRSPSGGNYCSLFANGEHLDLRQDVFVFVRAGEEGLRVGAERDDLAVVGACKVHCGKNHLTGNAAAFKALKDARVGYKKDCLLRTWVMQWAAP